MANDQIVSIIHALPMPVLLIGADERITASNQSVDAILGPGLIGKPFITVLRQPSVIEAIAETQRDQSPRNVRYTGRDEPRDTVYRVSVVAADDNIVLTFEDQTAAEDAGQMRRDFVANVSHELRTPLTALLGFVETLRGAAKDDSAARERFLGIMAHEANRMTRLVDDLMSLSRVEEDERVRPREQVDLGALLSSVIKGLEPQAKAVDVKVSLDLDSTDDLVLGDAGQLMQVFTNLVENAIKYGASGGEVRVSLSPRTNHRRVKGETVRVNVTDKGDGVPAHHIARLTERFYRVDNHRSREVGGTGLGLAIVKHIINRHRGRLLIESEVGQGTKVSVFLPTEAVS